MVKKIRAIEAYRLYLKVKREPLVSFQLFQSFWNAISETDRKWWLNEFQTTKQTVLTLQLFSACGALGSLDQAVIDPELITEIEKAW